VLCPLLILEGWGRVGCGDGARPRLVPDVPEPHTNPQISQFSTCPLVFRALWEA